MSQEAVFLKTGTHWENAFSGALGTHSLSMGAGPALGSPQPFCFREDQRSERKGQ